MSRLSTLFLPTLRDDPADAEALSHRLMVRAGLIRQLGAGLWTWLPAGHRVIQKVEAIIREEMDAIGGQEMLLPVLQPAEPWQRTGRYAIDELFKLEDRKGSPHVLAMTDEEALTVHVANDIRSYRELPMLLYQLQTKERDEPRPRAGVLRTREFTMKDAYSFDRDEEGLDATYERNIQAYDRIFDRSGLRWYRVESDVGMMGGSAAHEYMAPCEAGENEVALAPGYAANVEVASAEAQPVELPPGLDDPREVPDPGPDDRGGGRRSAGRARGSRPEGDPRRRLRARVPADARARRPPPERDQARERAWRGRSPGDQRGDLREAGSARIHRPCRRRRCPSSRTPRSRAEASSAAPTGPTNT